MRTLITNWARAVHEGDLDGVLANHSDDIIMFDVPPLSAGVPGIAAYAETWPPFFEWQASGASFDMMSLELTVCEGVAFAHALLRCGTDEDFRKNPENLLRLTLGLRKQNGSWGVTHEHHSFADKS